jgi:urease beta subunit
MRPGEYFFDGEDICANEGREAIELKVQNTGDRPIQVGSHYHFFETNKSLNFDRPKALGKRLNIPSGTAVRFEAGQEHTIELIDIGGKRLIHGFNRLVEGKVDEAKTKKKALASLALFLGEK